MDLELLIKLVGGASALIIAWRTIDRRASRKREIENVKLTAEFYNELPEGFHQKEIIKQFLEKEIYRIYHPESIEESERNSDILYGLLGSGSACVNYNPWLLLPFRVGSFNIFRVLECFSLNIRGH